LRSETIAMKSRLEEDLKIGDYEGLVLNRLMIDVFKPKLCHEKDVLVAAFPVRNRATAQHLSYYLSEGPFNFINSEASSSPDSDGNYILLVELDRNRESFTTLDQILQYVNQFAHTGDWHFTTPDTPADLAWSRENFTQSVPQDPEAFLARSAAEEPAAPAETAEEATGSPQVNEASAQPSTSQARASNINYRLMAKIIEKQITRSNLLFIKEFQKQLKKIIKDNRLILQQFKELKSDQHYLYKQLELHQKREKLGLLREQQDFKRIRDLQDRLSNLIIARSRDAENEANRLDAGPISVGQLQYQRPQEPGGRNEEGSDGDGSPPASAQFSLQPPGDGSTGSSQPATEIHIESAASPAAPDPSSEPPASVQADQFLQAVAQPVEESTDGDGEATPAASASLPSGIDSPASEDIPAAESRDEPSGESKDGSDRPPAPAEPSPGMSESEDDPLNTHFSLGLQASERKDYHTAIGHFTKITEIAPEEPRSYYNLAILYYRLKDYDTAHEYAKRALDLGAQAARRILNKVETKQVVTEIPDVDTVEYVVSEVAPEDETPAGGGDDPPRGEDSTAALTADAAAASASDLREDVPETAVETAAGFEPAAGSATDSPPEFPARTGVAPEAAVDSDAPESERFDYMDTMTITEMDLSPVEPDDDPWGGEHVFELSEQTTGPEREEWEAAADFPQESPQADASGPAKVMDETVGGTLAVSRLSPVPADEDDTLPPEAAAADEPVSEPPAAPDIPEDLSVATEVQPDPTAEAADPAAPIPPTPPLPASGPPPVASADAGNPAISAAPDIPEDLSAATEAIPDPDAESAEAPAPILSAIRAPESETAGSAAASGEPPPFSEASDAPDISAAAEAIAALSETPAEPAAPISPPIRTPESPDFYEPADAPAPAAPAEKIQGPSAEHSEPEHSEPAASVSADPSATPAPGIKETAEEYFTRGMAASRRKDYHEAISHFQKFTEQAPKEPRGPYNLAILYYRLKDYETAHVYARSALDLGAQAAQRILRKVEAKQADQETMGTDTLEYIAGEFPPDDNAPAADDDDPPRGEDPTAAMTTDAAAEPTFESLEDVSDAAAEATAGPEPAEKTDTDSLPEFPIMTGMEPESEVDWGTAPAGQFDYMDTMTISDADMNTLQSDDGLWEDENVFELSQPVAEAASTTRDKAADPPEGERMQPSDGSASSPPRDAENAQASPESQPATDSAPHTPKPAPGPAAVGAAPPQFPETNAVSPAAPKPSESTEMPAVSETIPAPAATPDPPAPQAAPAPPTAPAPAETEEEYFTRGMAASARKDYRRAIACFQKFIEQAPDEPRGPYNLAILYYRLKEYENARPWAQRALKQGAKAARRILDKIEKKTGGPAKSAASGSSPPSAEAAATTSRPQSFPPPASPASETERESAMAAESQGAMSAASELQTPSESGYAAQPGGPLGSDPEEDTVIWDADELEEEVNTEEEDIENIGAPYSISDDVIFFGPSNVEGDAQGRERPDTKLNAAASAEPAEARPQFSEQRPEAPAKPPAPPKGPAAPKAPADPEIERVFSLGQKAADQKEYLKAIQHFTKVTQLAVDDPRGYYNLAIVSYRLKFYETAREHAKRALELGAAAAQRIIEKIDAQQATV
jgi:tetratricopeptide (TPR) repeat protein